MSSAAGEIEFRNREQELDRLLERVPPGADSSTITFLRAPTGYGKTRLVDQVLSRLARFTPPNRRSRVRPRTI
jgi:hypothetical protein